MGQLQRADGVAGAFADHVQLAFQGVGDADRGAASDEHLADHRFDFFYRFAEIRAVDRHVAPAEKGLSFVLDRALDLVFTGNARCGLARQEHHADAIVPGRGQLDALFGHFLAEKGIGNLDQDARAIGGLGVCADRTTVGQVAQYGQSLFDDVVAFFALDMGDESDAAGVVFVGCVVQALGFRQIWMSHRAPRQKHFDNQQVASQFAAARQNPEINVRKTE